MQLVLQELLAVQSFVRSSNQHAHFYRLTPIGKAGPAFLPAYRCFVTVQPASALSRQCWYRTSRYCREGLPSPFRQCCYTTAVYFGADSQLGFTVRLPA